jgi:hypothetical protein
MLRMKSKDSALAKSKASSNEPEHEKDRKKRGKPTWTKPNENKRKSDSSLPQTGNVKSTRPEFWINVESSRCRRSKANNAKSKQAELCTDIEDPNRVLSITGRAKTEPDLLEPGKNMGESRWAESLNNGNGSRCTKSTAEIMKSGRAKLRINVMKPTIAKSTSDRALPNFEELRVDKDKSTIPKSGTSETKSGHAMLWRNIEGSKVAASIRDSKDTKPARVKPNTGDVEPPHAKDLNSVKGPRCKKSKIDVMNSKWPKLLSESDGSK